MGSANQPADEYASHASGQTIIVDPGDGGDIDIASKSGGVLTMLTDGARNLTPSPRGVCITAYSFAASELRNSDGTTAATLGYGDSADCISNGDGTWRCNLIHNFDPARNIYTMPAPDGEEDYTDTLVAAMTLRTNGEPLDLFFPPGDYHFYGPLPSDEDGDAPEIWDAFTWMASPSAKTVQHREETGSGNDIRDRAVFHVHLDNEDDIWLHIQRDYRFGPIYIGDGLAISLVDKGSLISLGDPEEPNSDKVTCRGVRILCDLSRAKNYGSSDIGDGRAWLINAGSDGYVLNKTNQSFALRLSHCFDTYLDVYIRGTKEGVINLYCDRLEGQVRGLTCGRVLLEVPSTTDSYVGSHWSRLFCENPLIGGAVSNSQIGLFRAETNGGTNATHPGDYALPASAEWSITATTSTIDFTFTGSYDCTDYFEPWTLIKLTPDEDEPEIYLVVSSVSANSITFYNITGKSYIPRALTGDGAGVTRYFGVGLIGIGQRFDCVSRSSGQNSLDIPDCAVVPDKTPTRLAGNCNGRGSDANSKQLPIIAAHCVGNLDSVFGGVDLIGSSDTPPHPLANPGGIGPRYSRSIRECIYDPTLRKFTAMPGRGVSSHNECARKLTFHTVEEEYGEDVYAYRPSDGGASIGWEIRDPRLMVDKVNTVVARIYVPGSSGVTVTASCEPGTTKTADSLGQGWHTETFSFDETETAGDIAGAFVKFTGSDYYLAWVTITQSEPVE